MLRSDDSNERQYSRLTQPNPTQPKKNILEMPFSPILPTALPTRCLLDVTGSALGYDVCFLIIKKKPARPN